jgi:purine-nucleoside phosphorylase
MPEARVAGHAGEVVSGRLGAARVVLLCGRAHLYEGHDARAVTAAVRWLAGAGVKRLVLTNAAGAVNPGMRPGTWMMIADQLNLTGTSPLEGAAHFEDMSEVYAAGWRDEFRWHAAQRGMVLHEGVYAGVRGPQFETPAEVRMLRLLGADAVGMSTVLEAMAARAGGLEVAGFSCLTNFAAGVGRGPLTHQEVLATGRAAAAGMAGLLTAVLGRG